MRREQPKQPADSRGGHGIATAGNGLHRILARGAALLLVPALLLAGWLLLFRGPGAERDLSAEVAGAQAGRQADALAREVRTLKGRLAAALALPAVDRVLAGADPAATADVERAHRPLFPDALSLRLIHLTNMGTAALPEDRLGLRNHIEVDLVRRAANEERPGPEAYRFGDRWLLSVAVLDRAGARGDRRVALLSFDGDALRGYLDTAGGDRGRFTLLQRLPGVTGDGYAVIAGPEPGPAAVRAAVAGTPWHVAFTPAPALLSVLEASTAQPVAATLAVLLAGLAGFLLVGLRYPALLRREVARADTAAEHRTPYTLEIPELAPLARGLRKLTLRQARIGGVEAAPRVLPEDVTAAAASSAPALASVSGPRDDLPEHIFRAYDIRGLADSELDDDTVYRIGAALGTLAGERGEQTLVLGYDGRTSSGRIKVGLERALLKTGRDVIDIGLVPTPLVYFATHLLEGAGSGVVVTGSHNPAEYNGIKMVLGRKPLAREAFERLRALAGTGKFSEGGGHTLQRDVIADYLDEVVSDVSIAMPLKVVVDAGNGATGHIAPTLFEELGCEVVPLYCEIDGRFPNRAPDTGVAANLQALVETVRSEEADFGVAFDGDGDRVAAVSGSGEIVDADYLLMLFARDIITRNPGADVVYDVKCSRNLPRLITSLGGRGVLWRSGHTNIRNKVAEVGALVGGELSGHVVFRERWYGFDDGMYAAARLAEIVSSGDGSLDALLAELPRSAATPEIILPVAERDKFQLVQAFLREADFGEGQVSDLDGVRVDFPRGWGLLRASNTGAALTARFEGDDEAALREVMDLFREQLRRVHPELDLPF